MNENKKAKHKQKQIIYFTKFTKWTWFTWKTQFFSPVLLFPVIVYRWSRSWAHVLSRILLQVSISTVFTCMFERTKIVINSAFNWTQNAVDNPMWAKNVMNIDFEEKYDFGSMRSWAEGEVSVGVFEPPTSTGSEALTFSLALALPHLLLLLLSVFLLLERTCNWKCVHNHWSWMRNVHLRLQYVA